MKSLVIGALCAGLALAGAGVSSPDWIVDGVMYQIQWMAFTPEGTIAAAEKRLPWVRDLGVTVLYVCPVFLADGEKDRSTWSARQVASGFDNPKNPYRIMDFHAIDPQYGTREDYVRFVKTAHSLGLKVIQDIVFMHVGPNVVFRREHPEYLQHNADGSLKTTTYHFPYLNFASEGLRNYLEDVLVRWVVEADIDGYRCDVADAVPLDFWESARKKLESAKSDVVLLAEGVRPENLVRAFDLNYNFPVCLTQLRTVLSGEENSQFNEWFAQGVDTNRFRGAARIRRAAELYAAQLPRGGKTMNFTENHDTAQDDFERRAEKRLGSANQALGLATVFALDGVPLVYNGQEIADASRHSFFGHRGIDWSRSGDDAARTRLALLRRLVALRRKYVALRRGRIRWLDNDRPEAVLSFIRETPGGESVRFVGNFSSQPVDVKVGKDLLHLKSWEFEFIVQAED